MTEKIKILDEILSRRSIRKYDDTKLSSDQVKLLMEAALRAPSARGKHPTQFVVVEDKEVLDSLSCMRETGVSFFRQVPLAIVVLGSPLETEMWIEDASLAAGWIQLQAESLNLGSCWAQVYGMHTGSGQDCTEYVRHLLDIPYQMEVLCVIAVGYSAEKKSIKDETALNWEKIHIGKYPPLLEDN